jgi:hypothetical protein
MDQTRFDALSRRVGSAHSRRAVARFLAASVAGGLGLGGVGGAMAGRRKRCRPRCNECERCRRGRCKPVTDYRACTGGGTCTRGFCCIGSVCNRGGGNNEQCCIGGTCSATAGGGERCCGSLTCDPDTQMRECCPPGDGWKCCPKGSIQDCTGDDTVCCPVGSKSGSCLLETPVCCPEGFAESCCPEGKTCDPSGCID